uniref:Uncharacterized protein n=1 Tax=Anopheles albimanus TaxID=7167 RepID=A0A182FZD8_ANOAL
MVVGPCGIRGIRGFYENRARVVLC